jgi:hypothetical protein
VLQDEFLTQNPKSEGQRGLLVSLNFGSEHVRRPIKVSAAALADLDFAARGDDRRRSGDRPVHPKGPVTPPCQTVFLRYR